jgi:hypothetical protein
VIRRCVIGSVSGAVRALLIVWLQGGLGQRLRGLWQRYRYASFPGQHHTAHTHIYYMAFIYMVYLTGKRCGRRVAGLLVLCLQLGTLLVIAQRCVMKQATNNFGLDDWNFGLDDWCLPV